ncbi:hypothetical protein CLIB1444_05S04676 [[Candida] jaroonii]|uniref:Uncharacterized protein n=1 Tax=[Candida] jaroonii TaxID=467808 RepID=A0ACA9Y8Y1_9ASCO|nr:hypothetical protein CLIB1444_05S04676 [[Candida] jaroonii]
MFKSISPEVKDIKEIRPMDPITIDPLMEPRMEPRMEPLMEPLMEPMIEPMEPPLPSINQSLKAKSLEDIKNQCSELISELDSDDNPEAIVKKHIGKLKKYNELRDIALGLVTMIADQRKLRTTDILEEMKVELGDDN